MPDSNKAPARRKPAKPNKGFPLFPHGNGFWAKKVRQKLCYFGKVSDDPTGQAALARWLEEKDELLAGRKPRPRGETGLTLAAMCNAFCTHKKNLLNSGELAPRTFDRYFKTCEMLIAHFGRTASVDGLRPDDFRDLRAKMARRWGPIALANEIQIVRSLFRFAFEAELVEKPTRFGPYLAKPSAKTLRGTRTAKGPKLFTPEEIKAVLAAGTVNTRAMVLLAINGALGNTELAMLPKSVLNNATSWLDYARAKTAVPRRIPLWPETVAALRAVAAARPTPNDPADERFAFIGPRGESYVGNNRGYRVHQETSRAIKRAGVIGRTFYDLRRTFQTVAEASRDLSAVQSIMGHAAAAGDMSAIYRQGVSDDRLRAVVDCVHAWLFGAKGGDA